MRRICLLTVPFLMCAVSAVHAGDKTADAPGIVVRIQSLDALLQNLNLVVKLVGQEEAANQIEAVIKSKVGKNGINGIDPARPIGAYVRFGKEIDQIGGAILIPVADETAILTLLDNLGVAYKKDQDGIYTHKTNKNVDVYFRFAHKYLYATSVSTESIQLKNLPDPAKALAIPGNATITVVARLDQISADAKRIAVENLQKSIQDAKASGLANETPAQQAFRAALLDDMSQFGKNVINDATDLRFDLDVNEKSRELTVNASITGRPQSELAKAIDALGKLKSPLAGMAKKDVAFQGAFHFTLPQATHRALESVIDEAAAKSLAGIQDASKKKQAKALFDAMMPSVKAGEKQIVAAVLGPTADRYTFIGAVKLKDGAKLGTEIRGLIAEAVQQSAPADKGKIQLDFDTFGSTQIHKLEVPKNAATEQLIDEIAGDKYLYLAFRDDAMFLAFGKDSLAVLKSGLANTAAVDSTPLLFDADVIRLAKWLAQTPKQKDHAAKLLAAGDNSRIRVSIEGGTTLRATARLHFSVLEFLMKTAKE